jgi:hypothetical protein
MRRVAGLVAALVIALAPGVAQADPYPPGTTTTTQAGGGGGGGGGGGTVQQGNQQGGSHVLGEEFTTEGCGFAPNSTETLTVDDQAAGTKKADANGCITVRIKIISSTKADVNDPVRVTIRCGSNDWTATGPAGSGTGQFRLVTAFDVACTARSGGTAFTGANVARWTLVAIVLIVLGGGLVLADRRRTQQA